MSQALHGLLPQFAHMHVQSFRLWIYSAHTLHIVDPIMDDLFESLRDENRPHPGNRTERKEAGLLPNGSKFGPSCAIRAKLGRGWSEVG